MRILAFAAYGIVAAIPPMQFGNTVSVPDDLDTEWSCMPHFYRFVLLPFIHLWKPACGIFVPEIQGEGAGFAPAYIEILSAGVAVKPETLLEQYGFDTGSAKFWQDGLNYVKARIEELTKTQ